MTAKLRQFACLIVCSPALLNAQEDKPPPPLRMTLEYIALPLSEMHRLVAAPRKAGAAGLRQQCRKLAADKRAIVVAAPIATVKHNEAMEFSSLLHSDYIKRSFLMSWQRNPIAPPEIQPAIPETTNSAAMGVSIKATTSLGSGDGYVLTDIVAKMSPTDAPLPSQTKPGPVRFVRTRSETKLEHRIGDWTLLCSFAARAPDGAPEPWSGLCFLMVEPAEGAIVGDGARQTTQLESILEAFVVPQQEAAKLLGDGPLDGAALRTATSKLVAAKKASLFDAVILASGSTGDLARMFAGEEFHSLVRKPPPQPERKAGENADAAVPPPVVPNILESQKHWTLDDSPLDLGWTLELDCRRGDDGEITSNVVAGWTRLDDKDAFAAAKLHAPPRHEHRELKTVSTLKDGLPSLIGTIMLPDEQGRVSSNDKCMLVFLTTTKR